MDTLLKHNKDVDWRDVDAEIMDFQVHVRKETGGNNHSVVDSTKLKISIENTLTKSNTELLKKIAEGEIERLNELLKILDWHEPYRVCLEDQLTHWQQVLQDLEK